MKKIISILLLAIPVISQAEEVRSARIDSAGENIVIELTRPGGCGKLSYSLEMQGGCAESMPVQCFAKLKSTGVDMCEAIVPDTAIISLASVGLVDSYYSGASLTISADGDKTVTVRLPEFASVPPAPTRPGGISFPTPQVPIETKEVCVTHTGSYLEINASAKTVKLETQDGQKEQYSIVARHAVSLESNPPIWQQTFKLDDGRSVVTSYRGDDRVGSGNFIRLSGEYSPEFKSCIR
ncbi:MAG TPA: hypothetical protein VM432_10105 [Bdellovibrionales bacterium]|nr:hypothetical protein [Bdellovibrionales bacterium]